jgi:hypothetical protein
MEKVILPVGIIGTLIGFVFVLFYIFNRIYRLIILIRREEAPKLGFFRSLRNLVLIALWVSVFGMMLFAGFFLRAFHSFAWEQPVAEVIVQPTDKPKLSEVTLIMLSKKDTIKKDTFLIHGDYWMVEGDVVKWTYMANFLGLNTRYRLNRIRGRFENEEEEKSTSPTVYNLSTKQGNFFWKTMYKLYKHFPFVRSVFGNAVYQSNELPQKYQIYITQSGFIIVPILE